MMSVVGAPLRPRVEYSVTNVIAVGKHPPRPRPARNLNNPSAPAEGANAHSRVNIENDATATSNARRRPIRSVTVPISRAPSIIPTSPTVATAAAVSGV